MIVIDASLAAKWYLDEALADEAEQVLFEHSGDIAVPDLFVSEVIGALVRRANMDKATRQSSEIAIRRFTSLFEAGAITAIRGDPEFAARAAALAMDIGHPVKDCMYLTLAMDLRCALVTADAKFGGKARRLWDRVRMLGE